MSTPDRKMAIALRTQKEKARAERNEKLRKKLLDLRAEWPTLPEADDSSDEENKTLFLHPNSTRYREKLSTIETPDALSLIVRAFGLSLYRSPEVNALYYPEKKKLLSDSKIIFDRDDIEEIVTVAVSTMVRSICDREALSPFFRRYIESIRKFFIDSPLCRDITSGFIKYFMDNPLLLYETVLSGKGFTISAELSKRMEDIVNALKKHFEHFIHGNKFNTFSNDEIGKIIALKNQTIEAVRKIVTELDLLTGINFFKPISQNRPKIARAKTKINKELETDKKKTEHDFNLYVLEMAGRQTASSNFSNVLNHEIDKFVEKYVAEKIHEWCSQKILREATSQEAKENADGVTTRSISFYTINRAAKDFSDSLFAQQETAFFLLIKAGISAKNLWDAFFRGIKLGKSNTKVYLERKTLGDIYEGVSSAPLSPVALVRLFNRAQIRAIRQQADNAREVKGSETRQIVARGLKFLHVNGVTGLEKQAISKHGVRSDQVDNMRSYEVSEAKEKKIKAKSDERKTKAEEKKKTNAKKTKEKKKTDTKKTKEKNEITVREELSSLMKLLGKNDVDIARYIRDLLQNGKLEDERLKRTTLQSAQKFLVNFTYMLFITEPARNPSCWIIHQMVLDLIINGHLTWQQALTSKAREIFMPMIIEKAVSGARQLGEEYADCVQRYSYAGDCNLGIAEKLKKSERSMIIEWFDKCAKKEWFDQSNKKAISKCSAEEIENIFNRAIKEWYNVSVVPQFEDEYRFKKQLLEQYFCKQTREQEVKGKSTETIPKIILAY